MNKRIVSTTLLLGSLLAACGAAEEPTPEAEAQDPVYGRDTYAADCNTATRQALDQSMFYGRTAANSVAFTECVTQAMAANYEGCAGDPAFTSVANQTSHALTAAHSANDVSIQCTGGGGIASAGIGVFGNTSPEALAFSGWLASVMTQLSQPVCGTPGADPMNCRFAAWPWPYSQMAGTIWHEASHQQGFGHDGCGITTPGWNFQSDTVPYIVGNCIAQVILESGAACGDTNVCGAGGRSLVTHIGGASCACVSDPGTYFSLTKTRNNHAEGRVTSSPSGINCDLGCTSAATYFPTSGTVTLTASPVGNSTFGGWTGCDTVSGTTCTTAAPRAVTARFNCAQSYGDCLDTCLDNCVSGGRTCLTNCTTRCGRCQ